MYMIMCYQYQASCQQRWVDYCLVIAFFGSIVVENEWDIPICCPCNNVYHSFSHGFVILSLD